MKKLIDKFGMLNIVISFICCFAFLLNNVLITKEALLNISDNLAVAYLLNFLLGCEGILGKCVEKRLGGIHYLLVFNLIAILDAVIVCLKTCSNCQMFII